MKDLEVFSGEQIPLIDKIGPRPWGAVVDDGRIVGLGLSNRGLTSLPMTIGDLSRLEILCLSGNEIRLRDVSVF